MQAVGTHSLEVADFRITSVKIIVAKKLLCHFWIDFSSVSSLTFAKAVYVSISGV